MADAVGDHCWLPLDGCAGLGVQLLIRRLESRVICCLKLKLTELNDGPNDEFHGGTVVDPLEQGWPSR